MRRIVLSFGVFLSFSCAPLESTATRTSPPPQALALPEGITASVKGETAGVITASIDPNAVDSQLLRASADSNISNVVLAFPPGSLAIATDISLREGASIGSELVLRDLGLASTPTVTNSAAAVEVTSSVAVDLKQPMILSLPLPTGLGLAIDPTQKQRLGVLYRIQVQSTGEKLVGYVPASELTIDENDKLLFPSLYFGSFQVVIFDQVVAKVESTDNQPTFEGIQYVLQGMALPSCGRPDVGRTIYVEETKQFQYCGATGWVVVDLRGPQGPQGATGATGPQGPAGTGGSTTPKNLAVYDANGAKVGRFLGNQSSRNYYTTLLDGTTVLLNADGQMSTITMADCYYTTTDCTGQCYLKLSPNVQVGDYVYISGLDVGGTGVSYANVKISGVNPTATYTTIKKYYTGFCSSDSSTNTTGFYTYSSYTPTSVGLPPFEIKTE